MTCFTYDPATNLPVYEMDLDASLPYGRDFTAWLGTSQIDETQTDVTVPSGLQKGSKWFQPAGHAGVWLSNDGSTVGDKHTCTVRVVTQDSPPRIDDYSFIIEMIDNSR